MTGTILIHLAVIGTALGVVRPGFAQERRPAKLAAVVKQLASDNVEQRWRAVRKLRRAGAPAARPLAEFVRVQSKNGLPGPGPKLAVMLLRELGRKSGQALQVAQTMAQSGTSGQKVWGVRMLGEIGRFHPDRLQDISESLRKGASVLLDRKAKKPAPARLPVEIIKGKAVLPVTNMKENTGKYTYRQNVTGVAAVRLHTSATRSPEQVLAKLESGNILQREVAAEDLLRVSPRWRDDDKAEAVKILSHVVQHFYRTARVHRIKGPVKIPGLKSFAVSNTYDVRRKAALALTRLQAPKDVAEIVRLVLLEHEDPMVRSRNALALGQGRGSAHVVRALVLLLRDDDRSVVREAATALGMLGPQAKDAAPALKKLIAGSDKVRAAFARIALQRIEATSR